MEKGEKYDYIFKNDAPAVTTNGNQPFESRANHHAPILPSEGDLQAWLEGYGCFKVDVDPRNMQPVLPHRNLYYFADGIMGVTGSHLMFFHQHSFRQNTLFKEIEFQKINSLEWHEYDKSVHEEYGVVIRYLIPGIVRLWVEVGYFWLPGGRDTEMECRIIYDDASEMYFYFRNTPENMQSIGEIRKRLSL